MAMRTRSSLMCWRPKASSDLVLTGFLHRPDWRCMDGLRHCSLRLRQAGAPCFGRQAQLEQANDSMLNTDELSAVTTALVVSHVFACAVLRFSARRHRDFLAKVTALPGQGLALAPRLLAIKYCFLWVRTPDEAKEASPLALLAFWGARLTGFSIVFWLCLVFPINLYLLANR